MDNIPLMVLFLKDAFPDMEVTVEQLTEAGYRLEVTHVENEAGFREALQEKSYDVILSDFNLSGFDAFGALEICQEWCPEVPFICISGAVGEETAVELMKMGAVDYVLKDSPGRLPFTLKRALDEAKEKAANHQLAKDSIESEQRFSQVAEAAQEWIWEVDTNGLYTYARPVVKSLLGYTPEEVVGKKYFYDFFTSEKREESKKTVFEVFSRKQILRGFENAMVHKNGSIVVVSTSGSPFFDKKGNLLGFRGLDEDITDRKRMLEELIVAKEKAEEGDRLKTAFIQNISHEIRTPLNGILGFGQLIAEKDLSAENRKMMLAMLRKSSERLMNTVSGYMDMALISSGAMPIHKEDFLLEPVFQEIIKKSKQLCEVGGLDLIADIPIGMDDLMIHSDPEFLKKIMDILIDNAIKFTYQGTIRCGLKIESSQIRFYVRDTGIGIEEDHLRLIFEMFRQEDVSMTRGYEGSGLGLSIAKGLVALLEGDLRVETEKGKGSEFSFVLPNAPMITLQSSDKQNKVKKAKKKKPLVLVAEDDEVNYLFLETVLKESGYNCMHAIEWFGSCGILQAEI